MEIRTFTEADEAAVVALWLAIWPNPLPHNHPALSIRKKLAVDRELFLVAIVEGKLVGTVMGGYDGHRGWIYSVAVDADYRRRGIATALLRQMEAALIKRGCLKINLQVIASNSEVVQFYETLGYGVEERISMGKKIPQNA